MNADELLKRVLEHGADEAGIQDRFSGSAEFYESCFNDLLAEPNYAELGAALEARDYKRAFACAHAIKGLAGNLGLTALFKAADSLTEAVRGGRGNGASEAYAELKAEYEALERLAGRSAAPALSELETLTAPADGSAKRMKTDDKVLRASVAAVVALFILMSFMFARINQNFRLNTTSESSMHLTETCNQVSLYVAENVATDWRVAHSVADNLIDGEYTDDAAIIEMLRQKTSIWGVSDLIIYTDNGYSISGAGRTQTNDLASDAIGRARQAGRYLSIIESSLVYTVPVETEAYYAGSRIAAVSAVRDMKTFLDDMQFSSFEGSARVYLTDGEGVVISMLSNPEAASAFNFKAIVESMTLEPIGGSFTLGDLLTPDIKTAFLATQGENQYYVVSTPIKTGTAPLQIFYMVPEQAVNSTTDGFSRQLVMFSVAIILVFGVLAFLAFLLIYQSRKKAFDNELLMRERMFDLLVRNTKTAFALFSVNEPRPDYVSNNIAEVIGDEFWALDFDGERYTLRNSKNTQAESIRAANEMLAAWDGKSVYRSGYIRDDDDDDDTPYRFEFQLYPIGEDGRTFVGIAQDVTQTYARELATKQAVELANAASEAKSRFLSNMSHDIRTPMNAIMNMTNFALESLDKPKELGSYLHTIRESGEHLLQLINDVLDMSRIESGRSAVASIPFDIKDKLRRQADMIKPLCEAKGQTLITDFSGLHTETVVGDSLKLSQIVMNLLSNAVKFTPEKGALRFTAADIPSLREDMASVRLTVEDNGIGISPEYLSHIFEPFSRADNTRVSAIEGTGLGLSICKSYVDAMGGSIRCESEEGEGSVFTVELFFLKAEGGSSESETFEREELGDAPFLGMRCLVAEDHHTNQVIAKTLLERLGFIVELVGDGREALDKFLASCAGAYDVIYMDIQMPVMDGYHATMEIRASEHADAKTVPIVAMTANAFDEDIERARFAGMDAYIGKPIVSFDLIEQTRKAIKKRRG